MTRVSHDPLGDYARQTLAARYRRLADAASTAAAELGGENRGDEARLLAACEDALAEVHVALGSLDATRRGRARAAS